ncbi:hypothetical protein L1887_14504 [Cichorium endivia]|nr:hypothetical protein L1887_14504 [Cichorium endivia]
MEMIGLPTNVSQCSEHALERLYISDSLNGTIPESLGRLANLRHIHLSENRLRGPIPEFLRRLRFLEVVDLSSNQLTGPIPTFLGNLTEIYLFSNQLNGSIPESFGKSTTLTILSLDSNRLSGPIPASLGRLVSLQIRLYLYDIKYTILLCTQPAAAAREPAAPSVTCQGLGFV